jgi:hypothetical protein
MSAFHVIQLYYRAAGPGAGVDESQFGVFGYLEDCPEGCSAHCVRPADNALLDFSDVVFVEVVLLTVVFPDPGVGLVGDFLPGQTLAGVVRGFGALPRVPKLVIWRLLRCLVPLLVGSALL